MEFELGWGEPEGGPSIIIFTSVHWSSYPIKLKLCNEGATKYTPLRHALDGRDMPTIPGDGYVISAKLGHEVLLRMNHLFNEHGS